MIGFYGTERVGEIRWRGVYVVHVFAALDAQNYYKTFSSARRITTI